VPLATPALLFSGHSDGQPEQPLRTSHPSPMRRNSTGLRIGGTMPSMIWRRLRIGGQTQPSGTSGRSTRGWWPRLTKPLRQPAIRVVLMQSLPAWSRTCKKKMMMDAGQHPHRLLSRITAGTSSHGAELHEADAPRPSEQAADPGRHGRTDHRGPGPAPPAQVVAVLAAVIPAADGNHGAGGPTHTKPQCHAGPLLAHRSPAMDAGTWKRKATRPPAAGGNARKGRAPGTRRTTPRVRSPRLESPAPGRTCGGPCRP